MHRFRFRAVITLDPQEPRPAALHPLASQYRNHTHALMIKASPLRYAGSARCFPAETCWDSAGPLRAGDRAWVTVTLTDDDADSCFDAGQRSHPMVRRRGRARHRRPPGLHRQQPILTPGVPRRRGHPDRLLYDAIVG